MLIYVVDLGQRCVIEKICLDFDYDYDWIVKKISDYDYDYDWL